MQKVATGTKGVSVADILPSWRHFFDWDHGDCPSGDICGVITHKLSIFPFSIWYIWYIMILDIVCCRHAKHNTEYFYIEPNLEIQRNGEKRKWLYWMHGEKKHIRNRTK